MASTAPAAPPKGDTKSRLARMAREGDPEQREQAAELYRTLTGEEPPPAAAPGPIADPAAAAHPSMLGRAAGAVKDFVTGPLNAGAASFNETVSGGVYPAALDFLGLSSPQYRQKLAEDHPIADVAGKGVGIAASAAIPGAPAAVIDQAVGRMGAAVAPRLAASGTGQVLRGAASGALTSGMANMTKSDGTGEGMANAFEEGLAPGAVGGAAFSALGQGMSAGDRALQSVSPRIKDLVSAKRAGLYESPELQGAPKGLDGVRKVAENASDAVLARDQAMSARDKRVFDADMAPHMSSDKIDVNKAQMALLQKYNDNLHRDTGEPKDPALAQALEDAAVSLGSTKTLAGMLDNLQVTRGKANFESTSPTPENTANRQVYDAQNQALDDVVPEQVRRARGEARKSLEGERRRHDILANTEGDISRGQTSAGDENVRVSREKRIATLLQRAGDENVPGREAKRYLEELAAQDPEIARQIELVRAKKAQEAARFSFEPLVPLNLAGTNEAAGYGPAMRQIARASAGRILQPGLEAGGAELGSKGGRYAPGLVPLLRDPVDALLGRKKR